MERLGYKRDNKQQDHDGAGRPFAGIGNATCILRSRDVRSAGGRNAGREAEREEKNACGGCVIEFVRYALDHKYPNEMWVYAPAGRGHTHTTDGGRAGQPTGAHFSLWMCNVHSAPCAVRRASGSPVLGGGMCREQSKGGG